MISLSAEDRKILNRISDEPRYWIRHFFPELQTEHHDAFSDLVDRLKGLWKDIRATRIDLCFALRITRADLEKPQRSIDNVIDLQRQQQKAGNRCVFEIDLVGNVLEVIELDSEVEPVIVRNLSQLKKVAVFWVGADFQIYCKGHPWSPKHKIEVLREIKSKKRDSLLSMTEYETVLRTHYEQCVRDEARVKYWFKRNELLQPSPEAIFQLSLWSFIDREVEWIEVAREPMFKDASRCDIKVITDNLDIYFIEIKWIGKSAVRKRDGDTVVAKPPHEFPVERAIDGAYQTKAYIDKNNAIEYDSRIRLGIYLVYDAYNPPQIPINYGKEIDDCVLLRPIEFALRSIPPSRATKGIAKAKGLVR